MLQLCYSIGIKHNVSILYIMKQVIVKPHHEEDIFVITRGRGGAEAEV